MKYYFIWFLLSLGFRFCSFQWLSCSTLFQVFQDLGMGHVTQAYRMPCLFCDAKLPYCRHSA